MWLGRAACNGLATGLVIGACSACTAPNPLFDETESGQTGETADASEGVAQDGDAATGAITDSGGQTQGSAEGEGDGGSSDSGSDGSSCGPCDAPKVCSTQTDDECVGFARAVFRVALPCMSQPSSIGTCAMPPFAVDDDQMMAPAGRYEVKLRVRGVVERVRFEGGTGEGPLVEAPRSTNPTWNAFVLQTSEPPSQYLLNGAVDQPIPTEIIDYEMRIEVDGGSTLTLRGDSDDEEGRINESSRGEPLVVEGIPPAPLAFDGQFVHVEILDVRLLPR